MMMLPLVVLAGVAAASASCPECDMTPAQVVGYWGYPAEEHRVDTDDGFTLSVLRIPRGRNQHHLEESRAPVILQHGLLDCAMGWIANLPNQSLAFMLADAGFDVWLPNNRGNRLSPSNCQTDECWEFSFHQMGMFDMPACVNYVLRITGHESLSFVGHSEGTTQAFIGLSETAALNSKINLFIGLAPVAFVGHQSSKILKALMEADVVYLIDLFRLKSFNRECWLETFLGKRLCHGEGALECAHMLTFLMGEDDHNMWHNKNTSRIDVYTSHDPAGTSVFNLKHWSQMASTGEFKRYDFGKRRNLEIYGSESPPAYDLGRIKVPMAFFTGGNDALSDPVDVRATMSALDPAKIVFSTGIPYYDHIDFIWGLDAADLVYKPVVDLLRRHRDPVQFNHAFGLPA
ncbi:Lipase [Plasmodiophora brassicae]|nr:hypothetical protein PBRA_004106 [Plasmodiophora brassicae]